MYRYYTINEPKDGSLSFPGTPAKTHGYGQNGVSFECVRECVYGYAEYAEELDAQTVKAHRLIAGPIPVYYSINEDMARREKEMMSFSDYRAGSKTEEYRRMVDDVSLLAAYRKGRIDPMYHEKVDRLAESYARRLAANMNDGSRIGASCPSVMIAGPANFPVRKKQKQVAAMDRNMSEWREIQGLISKIRSVGTGGISSDDPQAIAKLKLKLDRLEQHQALMKAANAAIRMKDTEKGDAKLAELGYSEDEIKQLREPDFCGRVGYPSFELTNNNANIKRIRDRMHVDGRDSSRVDQEFVDKITDMFGEDSDVFRVRVAGEFPKALPDSFIPMEWAEKASEAKAPVIERVHRIDIGIDVARYGDDSSVLSPVLDKRLQEQPEIYHHNDTMELTGHAVQLIKRYASGHPWASVHVKIDCDGLGVGVYDRLMELKDEIIQDVNDRLERTYGDADDDSRPPEFELEILECHFGGEGGTISEDDPIDYQTSTGLMWGAIREALRTQSIKLWYDDKQISQLSNRKYSVNSAGKIELEKKEAMKKRGLTSPDMGDALGLALYDPLVSDWSLD